MVGHRDIQATLRLAAASDVDVGTSSTDRSNAQSASDSLAFEL